MGAHTTDGSVLVGLELDPKNIDKDVQKLILKLANMNLKIENQTLKVKELQKAYDDLVSNTQKNKQITGLEKELDAVQNKIKSMLGNNGATGIVSKLISDAIAKNKMIDPNLGNTEIGKEFMNLIQRANELKQKLSEIKLNPQNSTEAQALMTKIQTMNNNIKILEIEAQKASEKINSMGKDTSGMENLDNKVKELKDDLNQLSQTEGLQKVVSQTQSVGASLKQATSLTDRFKGALSKISGVANVVGGRVTQAFSQIRNSAHSGTSAIEYFGNRIMRLAGTAMIFNLFRHGFLNLRHAIGNLIHHNDILSQSLNDIKANLLTAFAPIWNACLPAIQALGKALSWVSALIASVVSALFGKTITQSQQMAKGIYASSQATKKLKTNLGKAKKEAKDTNKVLASFDKINVLSDKKPKSALGKVDKKNLDNTQGDLNSQGGGLKPLKVPILFEFQEKNKELIDKITQIFQNMARIVKPIIKGIVDDVTWLWNQVFKPQNGGSWLDWLNDSLKYLADLIEKNPDVKDFFVSIAEGIAILAVATLLFKLINPEFLLIAASIGILIYAFKDWDRTVEWFKKNWQNLQLVLALFNPLLSTLVASIGLIGEAWDDAVVDFNNFKQELEWAKEDIENMWKSWSEFWGNVGKYIDEQKQGWSKMWGDIGDDWNKSWNDIFNKWNGFWENIGNGCKSGINGVLGYVERFINKIISGINFLIDKLNQVHITMPGWLGGGSFGVNINRLGNVSVPRLEQGAVLKGGNPFLAWVNDQPKGQTNVETPLSTMVDAFRVAMKDMGNNQPQVNIEATGNVSELIRFLNFKIKQEQGLQGTNFVTGDSWA